MVDIDTRFRPRASPSKQAGPLAYCYESQAARLSPERLQSASRWGRERSRTSLNATSSDAFTPPGSFSPNTARRPICPRVSAHALAGLCGPPPQCSAAAQGSASPMHPGPGKRTAGFEPARAQVLESKRWEQFAKALLRVASEVAGPRNLGQHSGRSCHFLNADKKSIESAAIHGGTNLGCRSHAVAS